MDFRDVYGQYLPVEGEPSDSGFVSVRCPLHEDSHASAGFHVRTGTFNCYVCGSLSAPAFLSLIGGLPIADCYPLVDSFRVEAGLISKEETFAPHTSPAVSNPQWEELVESARAGLDEGHPLVQEYMSSRGLTIDTLRRAEVGLLVAGRTHWGRESLVFPYRYDGRVVGVRYRDIAADKSGEPGCHFTLWGIDTLDGKAPTAIVVEGETDRLITLQALNWQWPVVSSPTAAFRREWQREFDGIRQVIAIPQDDEASQRGMVKGIRTALPGVHVLQLPWARKQVGKDIADWVRQRGEEALRSLIARTVESAGNWIWSWEEILARTMEDRPWLIENLLGRQQVAVIGGLPKVMKTHLALNVVRCILSPGSTLCGIPELRCGLQEPGKVLFLEEEGDWKEFRKRLMKTLDGCACEGNFFMGHHLGFRCDEDSWVDQISKFCGDHAIDLLVLDPFHRTYTADENAAGEVGAVWHRLQRLLSENKRLSILLLHHFNKTGSILDGWASLRGSSRIAAESDLGVFVDKRNPKEGPGVVVVIDGRAIISPTSSTGERTIKLAWDDARGVFIAI